jgi:hypothetical protein
LSGVAKQKHDKQQKPQKVVDDKEDQHCKPNNLIEQLNNQISNKGGIDGLSDEQKSMTSNAMMISNSHNEKFSAVENAFFDSLEKDSNLKVLT